MVGFNASNRSLSDFPLTHHYHFAQTYPLARRSHPTGAFHWLQEDPRPGVEMDLQQITPSPDPRHLVGGWRRLEQAFGITAEQQAAAGDKADGGLRLYVCLTTAHWWHEPEQWRQLSGTSTSTLPGEGEAPRAELATYLRDEAAHWLADRRYVTDFIRRHVPDARMMPRHGCVTDAETFERMERLPCTAVGMWLFPTGAFEEMADPRRRCFDASAAQPGLILFDDV